MNALDVLRLVVPFAWALAAGRAVLVLLDRPRAVRRPVPRLRPSVAVGTAVLRACGAATGRAPPAFDPGAVGVGAVLLVVAIAVDPRALPVAVLPIVLARGRRRRVAAADEAAVLDDLPEVLDLLALATSAGLTIGLAVTAVGRRGAGPVASALADAADRAGSGDGLLADALDDLPIAAGPVGDAVRPLTAGLAASLRTGAPLGPTLERLGAEARAHRRRRAEERARRVPVLLLFPLVCCVLPAFGLLTVVPLLVGALADLRP